MENNNVAIGKRTVTNMVVWNAGFFTQIELGPLSRILSITGKGSSVWKGDWPRWSVACLQMFSSTRSIHRRYFFKELISPYNIIKFHHKRSEWRFVHSSIRIHERDFVHFCWWNLYKRVWTPCLMHRCVPPRMPPRCFSYPLTLGLDPSAESSKIWHGAFCFTERTILKEWNALWPWKLN